MPIPDWQLPAGVDRGLWDYLHASDMAAEYDGQMRASPLAAADVAFCDRAFARPGKLLDMGCGTGRLCLHFAAKGFECVGVDLSDEMLARAKDHLQAAGINPATRYAIRYATANLTDASLLAGETFDYAACLFSTLGMVRGEENRAKVVANAYRVLKPGGRFVLHAHNRYFRRLGRNRVWRQRVKTLLRKPDAGDIAMSQAYAGAPLTLHHFTRREIVALLESAGFAVRDVLAIGDDGKSARGSWVYGFLGLGERSAEMNEPEAYATGCQSVAYASGSYSAVNPPGGPGGFSALHSSRPKNASWQRSAGPRSGRSLPPS